MFLLDAIGKQRASILTRALKAKLTQNLPSTQHEFKDGTSTEQTILGVRAAIQNEIDQRKALVLVCIEFRKAFDMVPVKAVINRLV